VTRGCELFQMGSFSRRCGVPLPCTNRFGRFRMLFSRCLPRQHFSADWNKISSAFSDVADFASLCCSNQCALSNDCQSSLLLFHHFCSREIIAGSSSFHAVGLVRGWVPCEHSRVVANSAATKWDPHSNGDPRFIKHRAKNKCRLSLRESGEYAAFAE